jgi:hypothetical protein
MCGPDPNGRATHDHALKIFTAAAINFRKTVYGRLLMD